MVDVCLVQMPYNSVERPSLALGLLKGYLRDKAIDGKVLYANVGFADTIGLAIYRLIEESTSSHLLGEWTFSGTVFPEMDLDFDDYLDRCIAALFPGFLRMIRRANPDVNFRELLWAVREKAADFISEQARAIVDSGARIVGCSSMFQQNCASLGVLKKIKALDPTVVTMMGGPNCEIPMGKAMHESFPWVDFTVTGEADPFFGEMCERLLNDGIASYKEEPLPLGVLGPKHRESEKVCGSKAIVMKMDETAIPDYDDYFESFEQSEFATYVRPSLMIETSRGCWWGVKNHCTFCGANAYGMTFRGKSPDRAMEEVTFLADRYDNNRFNVADNIIDMRYLRTLLPRLSEAEKDYFFFYQVKANLTRDQMKMMSDAGVRWLQPGIESLHDEFLKLVKKGTSAATNIFTLRLALEYGIRCYWNILLGIPGEEDEWYADLLEMLPLVFHLQPPGGFGPIRFDRFSPYYEQRDSFNLELEPFFSYKYIYPLEKEDLDNIAYFFDFRREEGPNGEQKPRFQSNYRMKALRMFEEWKRHFWAAGDLERPVLVMEDLGDRLEIMDTRPIATASKHQLEGLEASVYRVMDRPITQVAIVRYLDKEWDIQTNHEEVEKAVSSLRDRKLILEASNRVLALAMRHPVKPFPRMEDSPASSVDMNRLFKEFGKDSLIFTSSQVVNLSKKKSEAASTTI